MSNEQPKKAQIVFRYLCLVIFSALIVGGLVVCFGQSIPKPSPDVTLTIFDKPHAIRYEADGHKYVIDLDSCTMSDGDTTLRFSEEEAARIHGLLGIVGKYVADSDVWFHDEDVRKKYWQEQQQSEQARRKAD